MNQKITPQRYGVSHSCYAAVPWSWLYPERAQQHRLAARHTSRKVCSLIELQSLIDNEKAGEMSLHMRLEHGGHHDTKRKKKKVTQGTKPTSRLE